MEAGGGGRRGKEEEEWGKRVLKMRDGICRPIERKRWEGERVERVLA